MNNITEINMADLRKQTTLGHDTPAGTQPPLHPEISASLGKFKDTLLGLIDDGFRQVVITDKTKNTPNETPYYQIIVGHQNLVIHDAIGNTIQRKISYTWDTLNVTIDGQPGDMTLINTYFQKMVTDMDQDKVEMFHA